MAHLIEGEPANFEVHFLHSADPRHGFCVMSTNPLVYYEFRTPVGFLSTHTIVSDASGATLVIFNWFGPSALGTMTFLGPPAREAHMAELVMPIRSFPDSCAFLCEGPDGIMRLFWWHRLAHGNYDGCFANTNHQRYFPSETTMLHSTSASRTSRSYSMRYSHYL